MGSKGAAIATAIVAPVVALGTGLAAGAEIYKGVEANKQRKAAEAAAAEQARAAQALQDKLLADQKAAQDAAAKDEQTKSDAASADAGNAARDASRRRQQALRAGSGSRQSTILTSPLGDTGAATTTSKTLLGS